MHADGLVPVHPRADAHAHGQAWQALPEDEVGRAKGQGVGLRVATARDTQDLTRLTCRRVGDICHAVARTERSLRFMSAKKRYTACHAVDRYYVLCETYVLDTQLDLTYACQAS